MTTIETQGLNIQLLFHYQFKLDIRMSRRISCFPSTSAPSGRVFFTAGNTVTKLRASLISARAAALIFLHESWPLVEEYEAAKNKMRKKRKEKTTDHNNNKINGWN